MKRTHENWNEHAKIKLGSERSFGLLFALIFLIIGLWPFFSGNNFRLWALGVSFVLILCAVFVPTILKPINMAWIKLGLIMHKIVNPLVLGFIFFFTVLPTGLIFRMLGKDILKLRFDPESETYWQQRKEPGPDPITMKRQF